MNYFSPESVTGEVNNRFTYHPPANKEQVDRYGSIRIDAADFAVGLLRRCPESRELSLALTKLEECVFWGNAAIARNESPATDWMKDIGAGTRGRMLTRKEIETGISEGENKCLNH